MPNRDELAFAKEENMEEIASRTAKKTVLEILTLFGIDTSDPIKAQQVMMNIRETVELVTGEEFVKDQIHLRKQRKAFEAISDISLKTAVGVIIVGSIGTFWAFLVWVFENIKHIGKT